MNKTIITVITFFACLNLIAQKAKKYKVYFKVDKYELTEDEKVNLMSFIEEHKANIKHISFVGYCDDSADNNYNLLLSKKRAICVKELVYQLLKKQIPYSLKYFGELGLNEIQKIENQRKENRRVEITFELFNDAKINAKTKKNTITKTAISKPVTKGNSYNDFLNYRAELEPSVKEERTQFIKKQKHLDSISKIVTDEEIKNFEQEFFATKIGEPLPTELKYFIIKNKYDENNPKILLKLSSRKKLKLLSVLMLKYPNLKVKLYTYVYKEMHFKRIRHNEEIKRFFDYVNSKKIFAVIQYLIKEGIDENRLVSKYELVKKIKLNASNVDRSPEVTEIIRLN